MVGNLSTRPKPVQPKARPSSSPSGLIQAASGPTTSACFAHRPSGCSKDLRRALARLTPVLLLSLVAATGCSTKVDVSSNTRKVAGESVEAFETKVALEILADQETPLIPSPPEVLPVPSVGTDKAVEVNGNRNVVIAVDGGLQVHLHLDHRRHEQRPGLARNSPEPTRIEARRPVVDRTV